MPTLIANDGTVTRKSLLIGSEDASLIIPGGAQCLDPSKDQSAVQSKKK